MTIAQAGQPLVVNPLECIDPYSALVNTYKIKIAAIICVNYDSTLLLPVCSVVRRDLDKEMCYSCSLAGFEVYSHSCKIP